MIPHDGSSFVQEGTDFGIWFAFQEFGKEVGVVATAGFDEDLLDGGTLYDGQFLLHIGRVFIASILVSPRALRP